MNQLQQFPPLRIILVAPKYAGNVGACARVAANFGVTDIVAVTPQCDIHDEEAKLYGKGPARAYLEGIRFASSLQEALSDCTAAIAITRRVGGLSPAELLLTDLPVWVSEHVHKAGPEGCVALVFGREDNCLTREETLLCTRFCQIPTSTVMPTMNLSHAVAVVVARIYVDKWGDELTNSRTQELTKGRLDEKMSTGSMQSTSSSLLDVELGQRADDGSDQPDFQATIEEFEGMMAHWRETLVAAGLTRGPDPDRMLNRLRRLMQRADPTRQDVGIMRRFFSKTMLALGARGTRGRGE